MIRYMKGKISSVNKDHIVIDTGTFGFEIYLDEESLSVLNEGDDVLLYTYFSFGDEPRIYGFVDERKRELFIKLISVSKLGPKTALKILGAGIDRIIKAIRSEDAAALASLPGIGKRTAERIIVELKDKVKDYKVEQESGLISEAIEALKALGFSSKESYEAVKSVKDKRDLSEIIKAALNKLMERK
ncbi:MAG: Holliday junction branch migration protein RuvA [Thermotogaceae bacterium]|nr:Holliday junction branch migration protein RuvA [Thermotogaceae bacterium]